MSIAYRAAGAAILLFLSVFIGKAYEKYCERALSETKELLRMLLHMRGKISTFLSPQSGLLSDFESEVLSSTGFLVAVQEGKTLFDAYGGSRFAISKEQKRAFLRFFSEFGRGYKSEELSRIDSLYRETSEELKKERERTAKDIKIAKTLLIAAALGISVLMI